MIRSVLMRYVSPILALAFVLVFPIRAFNSGASDVEAAGEVRHSADQSSEKLTAGSSSKVSLVPAHLLQVPSAVEAVVVVDLLDNSLYLIKNGERLAKSGAYYVSIGKNGVDKMREGDEKTPVGVYFISSFLPDRVLPEIYGAGAFPIDYPNRWDRRLGRTGSGIWIHGSDKTNADLPPRSSRGCLTLVNPDFISLASHMQVRRTPVIVANAIDWVSADQVERESSSLAQVIETWRRDWASRDSDRYLSHYSPVFRSPDKTAAEWNEHKRRVNGAKSFIEVGISELGLYRYPGEDDLVLATFAQDYKSNNFDSSVSKQQYWRKEDGQWKIVYEGG